jgi:uncharacterized repeat protein (TIGR01451 family)
MWEFKSNGILGLLETLGENLSDKTVRRSRISENFLKRFENRIEKIEARLKSNVLEATNTVLLPEEDPTVSTDKADYAPGATVTITASNFTPGSTILFEIADDKSDPGDDGDADVYEPFSVTDGGVRDLDGEANGTVVTTWVVPPAPEALNATLNLTATGSGSQVATTTFTDAFPLTPPVQTYFVPLREDNLFTSFDTINPITSGNINTLISIAIAADNTIVYYDHWEDGYEADVTNPTQATTLILGDDNPANGSLTSFINPSTGLPYTSDIFSGGDALVLENDVPTPRDPNVILFDGSDRIQSTFPIAVTRGAFPDNPGSLLAGAVEVLDTDSWGTQFVVPVGEDTPGISGTQGFEYTALYVMAGQDNTEIFLDTGGGPVSQGVIDQGENLVLRVDQGDVVTSSSPVQADIVAGDIGSNYEIRWYSLAPREDWSNDYYTPVGDGVESGNGNDGPTRVWLYNPNDSAITVTFERLVSGTLTSSTITVNAGTTALSPEIPDNSGGHFFTSGGEDFFALTQTDSTGGTDNSGRTFDWGHPLIPANQLTSQALVGWGYGNTQNNPNFNSYSVVWVTPVADADIFVDFDGDGVVDQTFDNISALQGIKIIDPTDQDMTGALIYATDTTGNLANPVDIAVAWGQDPARTGTDGTSQSQSLDLGTVIPALPILEAGKISQLDTDADGDGEISPGDTLLYSINIVNIGQVDLPAGSFNVLDFFSPVFDDATYVLNSTQYDSDGNGTPDSAIPDSGTTAFPLDENGFTNTVALPKGGNQIITFKVVIDDFEDLTPGTTSIINQGILRPPGGDPNDPIDEFETEDPLNFQTGIDIEKATNGDDADSPTGPNIPAGDTVTWTYEVTNTGNVWLSNISVNDDQLGAITNLIDNGNGDNILQPGETWVYEASGTAQLGQYANLGTATGNPVYADGTTPVQGLTAPTDSDPSHYFGVANPEIELMKDGVYNDVDDSGTLNPGDTLDYTFNVTNTGNVAVTGVTINEVSFDLPGPIVITPPADIDLSPGESQQWTGTYILTQTDIDAIAVDPLVDNVAQASGTDPNGGGVDSNEDPAQIPFDLEAVLSLVKDGAYTDVGGDGLNPSWGYLGLHLHRN